MNNVNKFNWDSEKKQLLEQQFWIKNTFALCHYSPHQKHKMKSNFTLPVDYQ